MAESYDIQLTDPLSAAFKIRAFTSNGPNFPISSTLNSSAVGAETSLLIFGKGHPEYGERTGEDLLHLLENFSGSSEPKYPVSGQLWYTRYTVIRDAALDFYLWDDATSMWGQFIPDLTNPDISLVNDGDYKFVDPTLFLAVKAPSHPMSDVWLPRIWEDRNVTAPTPTDLPRKELVVYTGTDWKTVNSVNVSEENEPTSALMGDLWYDSSVPQLKIYDGAAFVSVADRYLELGGGIMTGEIDMGALNIINAADPRAGAGFEQDVTTRDWVTSAISTATSSIPSVLNDLTDVTVPTPNYDEFLKFVMGAPDHWESSALALSDVGVDTTAANINLAFNGTAIVDNIQDQIDLISGVSLDFLPLDGSVAMIGAITLPGAPTSGSNQAATAAYVEGLISGLPAGVSLIEDLSNVDSATATLNQVLQWNGADWVNVTFTPTVISSDVDHTTEQRFLRDTLPASFPTVQLDEVIETTTGNFHNRLNKLDDFARREVFVATVAQTEFEFTDGKYLVGSNRLIVHLNGAKQYADERARQRISFSQFTNISSTSPLGFTAAGVYDLDIDIDGGGATIVVFNLDSTSTIETIVSAINSQLTSSVGNAVWNNTDACIHVFSTTTGNGSSVDMVEGSGVGLAVDGGLLTALSAVPGGTELPVLNFTAFTIFPAFPTNVTDITNDFAYKEIFPVVTPGYQVVDVGGAKVGGDPTGLTNDATVYTASIIIDGGAPQGISIVGSAAQDFTSLLTELGLDITGAFIDIVTGNITITSNTPGAVSAVAITDVDLFSSLTGYVGINSAVAGTEIIETTHGSVATKIRFNTAMTGGETIELISEATSNLIS